MMVRYCVPTRPPSVFQHIGSVMEKLTVTQDGTSPTAVSFVVTWYLIRGIVLAEQYVTEEAIQQFLPFSNTAVTSVAYLVVW